ncbi:MAG: ribosomal protein S18-alanine N-acetyltransferase, partial [Eubacteriales bacterium]|nr:ribosomal protein S18-alanine N-acetyltransferase [Eubacteriales bacterium]
EAFEEEIRGNKLSYYTVADVQGVIVGYAGMWIVADEAHIMNIAVLPAYRRHGMGSLLLNELISTAAKKNIGKMTLEVRKSNLAARALYQKFGFVPAGQRKAYYADNREDAVIMWKNDILEGN